MGFHKIKLSTFIFVGFLFMSCNSDEAPQTVFTDDYPPPNTVIAEQDYWAKDNFDLQRVGNLLERADSPAEFESYLNEDDGINNLDLNGDGYVDYISVDEFDDYDSNTRGISLFTRFGPDIIQEIARIFFYRDNLDYTGSRVLIVGDDRLYGDNYYYETNWLDRPVDLVSYLFSDHDQFYRSPYYYDNYPTGYVVYEVVETPVYVTRVERLYTEPVFISTAAPTFISKVKIKSPHNGKTMEKIHAKLVKPTKAQEAFIKNTPARRGFGKVEKENRGRDDAPVAPAREDKPAKPDRGPEPKTPNAGPPTDNSPAAKPNPAPKAPKAEKPGKAQGQEPGKAHGGGQGKGQGGGGKGKKP